MFINTGGTYKGVNYSTMYDRMTKHENICPNEKFYVQMGNIDDENGPTEDYAILVFDIDTDEMVYAEPVAEKPRQMECFSLYQRRMAKQLYQKLSWLQ